MENYKNLEKEVINLTKQLSILLIKKNLSLALAESCTGGEAAASITKIPGSSKFFVGGIVAYSDTSKLKLLKVKKETLDNLGPESAECAKEMLSGTLQLFNADISAITTGISGPSDHHGVKAGTVFLAVSNNKKNIVKKIKFTGTREEVIKKSVINLFRIMILLIKEK